MFKYQGELKTVTTAKEKWDTEGKLLPLRISDANNYRNIKIFQVMQSMVQGICDSGAPRQSLLSHKHVTDDANIKTKFSNIVVNKNYQHFDTTNSGSTKLVWHQNVQQFTTKNLQWRRQLDLKQSMSMHAKIIKTANKQA